MPGRRSPRSNSILRPRHVHTLALCQYVGARKVQSGLFQSDWRSIWITKPPISRWQCKESRASAPPARSAKQQIEKHTIPVLSCEGPCIRGDIARLAANYLAHDMPSFARACHAETFFVPHSSMARWVKQAPKSAWIDGCFLKCHGRALKGLIGAEDDPFRCIAVLQEVQRHLLDGGRSRRGTQSGSATGGRQAHRKAEGAERYSSSLASFPRRSPWCSAISSSSRPPSPKEGVKTFGRILAVWMFHPCGAVAAGGRLCDLCRLLSRRVHAADALGREALRPDLAHLPTSQSDVRHSRGAFMTTDTELSAIAAPARPGETAKQPERRIEHAGGKPECRARCSQKRTRGSP